METYANRDALLHEMGFTSYAEYLASQLWSGIRTAAFQLHGAQCKLCKSRAVVIHHLSYNKSVLLGKDLNGLAPLCDKCHYKVEFSKKNRKHSLEEAKTVFDRLANSKKSKRCNLCGNKIRKRGGACRSCHGTGITSYPISHKAAGFLRQQSKLKESI